MSQYLRQQGLIDQGKLSKLPITVIGAGAIGSMVTLGLAKIGAETLRVFDDDKVEEHNLSNQWYGLGDLGRHKVLALNDRVIELAGVHIQAVTLRYDEASVAAHRAYDPEPALLICCVDSMDTRIAIWEQLKKDHHKPELYIDARMGAEVGTVLTTVVGSPAYEQELYPSSEAFQAPCTARATMYCAMGLAAFVIAQVTRWLRNEEPKAQLTIDFRQALLL